MTTKELNGVTLVTRNDANEGPSGASVQGNIVHIDPCPVEGCGRKDFKSAQERGRHLYAAHGIPGSSSTAIANRNKQAASPLFPRHDALSSNSRVRRTPVDSQEMGVRVGITVGKFIAHAHGCANDMSLSPSDFTQLVAKAFFREAFGRDPQ